MADVFSFLFNHFLKSVLTTLTWLSTVSVFFATTQWPMLILNLIMNLIGLDVIYWGVVDLGELLWSVVERGGATWTMKARGEVLNTFFRTYMYVDEFIVYFLYILLIYIREHESSKWIIDRWTLKKNTSQVFSCDTSIFSTVCNTRFIWLISRVWTFVPPTWFGDKKNVTSQCIYLFWMCNKVHPW